MAIVKLRPGYEHLRGAMGNLVLKHYGTKVVLTRKPVFRNRKFSTAQKACQARFREAALLASRLMADPRAREAYEQEARAKGKPARSLMIADYLNAHALTRRIRNRVHDSFHDEMNRWTCPFQECTVTSMSGVPSERSEIRYAEVCDPMTGEDTT